jgi:hypothetical protein
MSQQALGGLAVAKTVLFAEGSEFDSQTQWKAFFSRYFNQVFLFNLISIILWYIYIYLQSSYTKMLSPSKAGQTKNYSHSKLVLKQTMHAGGPE